jgi:quercetin dioxygenase-like cupin family protein
MLRKNIGGLDQSREDRMGRVVTFAELPASNIAPGVSSAPITSGETREMAAELIRISPGERWIATPPRGSDCYLFMLEGAGTVCAAGRRHRLPPQAFAALEEGVELTFENDGGAPARIIKMIAPPYPDGRSMPGFRDKIAVAERGNAPMVDLPKEKKTRIYFVADAAVKSQRGHAMIVVYEKDTVTGLHHHPNAESMFVMLEGALTFTVNGKQVLLTPGQAAYFGCNDQHGLRVAEEAPGASFLEFHIPAAFSTVYGPES